MIGLRSEKKDSTNYCFMFLSENKGKKHFYSTNCFKLTRSLTINFSCELGIVAIYTYVFVVNS